MSPWSYGPQGSDRQGRSLRTDGALETEHRVAYPGRKTVAAISVRQSVSSPIRLFARAEGVKGKTCFHVRQVDEELEAELKGIIARGFDLSQAM